MCVVLSLVPPMLSVAWALVERVSVVRCVRSYVAGFESTFAYCVVVNCAPVVPFHELTCRQPRSPTCSSKRQLAQAVPGCPGPVSRQRRQDGWTSTPRASRGATAETTPTRHDEGAECDVFLCASLLIGWLRATGVKLDRLRQA